MRKPPIDNLEVQTPLHICMIAGLAEVEEAGNQSTKNALKYLESFGHQIDFYSFFPSGFENLVDPRTTFGSSVRFHRLPGWTRPAMKRIKSAKTAIGTRRTEEHSASSATGYYAGETYVGRIIYVLFLFAFYIPFEFIRVGSRSLWRRPDIYYGLNWQGAVVARLLGSVFRRPVITRFHGTTLLPNQVTSRVQRIRMLDEVVALRTRADAIIMTNDGTRGAEVLERLGADMHRVHFWTNGLDEESLALPESFDRDSWVRKSDLAGRRIVLMVSRLARWKRVDRGVHCLTSLKERGFGDELLMVVIGDGPERESLEALAKHLNVADMARFVGALPHEEVARYFAVADVFTSFYDVSNLGNPLLEAIYFGVPIVTIDDGSTASLLRNGEHGFLVPLPRFDEEASSRIADLLSSPELSNRVRQNLRTLKTEHLLSWEQRMRLEVQLISRIVQSAGDGH